MSLIVAVTARKPLVSIPLAILLAFTPLAQTGAAPDLSGTWVLNLAKSKLGKHPSVSSKTIVITYPHSDATIQMRSTSDGKLSTEEFTPDGKEHVSLQTAENQMFTKAQWKKSVLVAEMGGRITSGPASGYEPISLKSRWTLSADGRVLTEETDDPRQVFVYDKQ
jgi:hypothetical protein